MLCWGGRLSGNDDRVRTRREEEGSSHLVGVKLAVRDIVFVVAVFRHPEGAEQVLGLGLGLLVPDPDLHEELVNAGGDLQYPHREGRVRGHNWQQTPLLMGEAKRH